MPRSLTTHEREIFAAAIEDLRYIDDAEGKAEYLVDVLTQDLGWPEDDAVELSSFIVYENQSKDPFRLVPVAWDRMPLLAGCWS